MFRKNGYLSTLLAVRQDNKGRRWHFSYWMTGPSSSERAQRLFFWDDARLETGVNIFIGPLTRPFRQIEKLVEKLVREPELRRAYRRELRFPLDRYYGDFGSFPEEHACLQTPEAQVPKN